MKFQYAVLCSAALSASAPIDDDQLDEQLFNDFESRFEKQYDVTSGERSFRKSIFVSNMKYIKDFNEKHEDDDTDGLVLGVGPFADLTFEEYSEQYATDSAYENRNDSHPLWGDLPRLGTEEDDVRLSNVPDSINWNQKGGVTRPKNQGSCGSCWTFATVGALEGAYFRETRNLIELSEQQLLDCNKANWGCRGGWPDKAFSWVKSNGICGEYSYPYQCRNKNSRACTGSKCHSNCGNVISPGSLSGYIDVHKYDSYAMMVAVAHGPVAIIIDADSSYFQHYHGGVITSPYCGTKQTHAVLAVGYGTAPRGTQYWLVKNSWGTNYGVGGFLKIGRGLNAGKGGECGILKTASYPILDYEGKMMVKNSRPEAILV